MVLSDSVKILVEYRRRSPLPMVNPLILHSTIDFWWLDPTPQYLIFFHRYELPI